MYVQLIVSLALMILAYALKPKPPQPIPAGLADVQAPTAQLGLAIPVVFGTIKLLAPNVLWYGDISTTEIRSGK